MVLNIDMSSGTTQIAQIAQQLGVPIIDNEATLPASFGTGWVKYYPIGDGLDMHHYHFCLAKPLVVHSHSPKENGLYIMNFNLSDEVLEKEIGGNAVKISPKLPSGVFFYSPGNSAKGGSPLGVPFEIVFVTFTPAFLHSFQHSLPTLLNNSDTFCIYESLSPHHETQLKEGLAKGMDNLQDHLSLFGQVLAFMADIFSRLENRSIHTGTSYSPQELERLFAVREILRSHIKDRPPTLDQIAKSLGTNGTKLKTQYKAFFGKSIYQYYLEMKMDTAVNMLKQQDATISEIGYTLGYSNISQFIRTFKKHYGKTPKEYRGSLGNAR